MKKALFVGINYNGTKHKLNGCVNDIRLANKVLTEHYGFTNKKVLTNNQASYKNILNRLRWLVKDAKAGDVLYFHFSGHGSQVPNLNPQHDYEPDGKDEIIVPIDLKPNNWNTHAIKDDDFKKIIEKVPKGVNLTAVLDCCHSGDGLRSFPNPMNDVRSRFIEPPVDISVNLTTFPVHSRMLKNKYNNQVGILISGCGSSQTSADAYIDDGYYGACTYYLYKLLKNKKYKRSYKELVDNLNIVMNKYGFTQNPELNCGDQYKTKLFLESFKV